VYLATLWVADRELWSAVGPLLEGFAADGTATEEQPA
jgi:hypothetical protein